MLSVHVACGFTPTQIFIFLFLLTAELSDSRLVPEKSSKMLCSATADLLIFLTIFKIALESLF